MIAVSPLICSHFSDHFLRSLQQFKESRYLCDVRLISDDDVEFPAHRLVLAANSPFFSNLFQANRDAQDDVKTVHLRNCSAECVQIVLQFLYSGELQLKECDPGKVLSVARTCRIAALEQMLANYASTASPSLPSDSSSPSSKQNIDSISPKTDASDLSTLTSVSGGHKRKAAKTLSSGSDDSSKKMAKTSCGDARKISVKTEFLQEQISPQLPSVQHQQPRSNIFMQNNVHHMGVFCPLHGLFACGCPFAIMASTPSQNPPGPDPGMAAAFQQLFFGAAAAAAAAAASQNAMADDKDSMNGEKSTSATTYSTTLPKTSRSKIATSSQATDFRRFNVDELNVPTAAAFQAAAAQRALQQHAEMLNAASATTPSGSTGRQQKNGNSGNATNSATVGQGNDTKTSFAQLMQTTPQPAGQDTRVASSLNTVQVPADDKEGWCRNKKYIKKTPQGYQCTVCKKTYGRYNSVSYHVTIYHRNPPIQCDQPGCTFSTREARYIHFHKYYRHDIALPTNIDLETRRCPFCKHVAKSPAMLDKHINRHMPDSIRVDRTYNCALCDKALSSRPSLVQHMLVHEGEKELSCDKCSYRGRTVTNLQQHKLFKHSNVGDLWCTKFQCDECQFSTPSQSQLSAHRTNAHHARKNEDHESESVGDKEHLSVGENGANDDECTFEDEEYDEGVLGGDLSIDTGSEKRTV